MHPNCICLKPQKSLSYHREAPTLQFIPKDEGEHSKIITKPVSQEAKDANTKNHMHFDALNYNKGDS